MPESLDRLRADPLQARLLPRHHRGHARWLFRRRALDLRPLEGRHHALSDLLGAANHWLLHLLLLLLLLGHGLLLSLHLRSNIDWRLLGHHLLLPALEGTELYKNDLGKSKMICGKKDLCVVTKMIWASL